MRLLLNVLWFIFGGWISGTLWLLATAILAITVIGLPWTPAALRLAGFSYAPFGKRIVERDPGAVSLLLNIVWLVFAGWWLALLHIVHGVAQCVTIIGIPFGIANFKLVPAAFWPLGREIVDL